MQIAYLLGIPRSGTTLLSALLNQHKDVYCPPEPWTMLATASLGTVPAANAADAALIRQASAGYTADSVLHRDLALRIYDSMMTGRTASYLVDKTPRYHHCLDYIAATMPEARYLWIIRNPLDVAASYQSTWNNDVVAALRNGVDHAIMFDFALGFRRLLDFARIHHVHVVRYEDLVSAPASIMSGVFTHLGLAAPDFEEDLAAGMRPLLGSAFGDVKIAQTTTVHKRSVGRYVETIGEDGARLLCAMMGRDLLSELGYPELYDRHDAGSLEDAAGLPIKIDRNARRMEKKRQALSVRPYSYWQRQRALAGAYRASIRRARQAETTAGVLGGQTDARASALEARWRAMVQLDTQFSMASEAIQQIDTRTASGSELLGQIGRQIATLAATQERDRALYLKSREELTSLIGRLDQSESLRGRAEAALAKSEQEIVSLQAKVRDLQRSPLARLLGRK
jgi:hypothetical protein